MTADDLPRTALGRLIEAGKIAGAIAAILALLGSLYAVAFGPARAVYGSWTSLQEAVVSQGAALEGQGEILGRLDAALASSEARAAAMEDALAAYMAESTSRFDGLGQSLAVLSDDIERMALPTEVFKVGRASRAVEGYCVETRPCDIVVFARRTPQGAACQVIPGRSRYAFYSRDMMQRREVERLDSRPVQNIDSEWTEVVMTIATPTGFGTGAEYVFVRSYDHCLGPDDTEVVTQESDPPISIIICPLAPRPDDPECPPDAPCPPCIGAPP